MLRACAEAGTGPGDRGDTPELHETGLLGRAGWGVVQHCFA